MSEVALNMFINPALDVAKLNVLIRALKESLGPLGKSIKMIDAKAVEDEMRKVTAVVSGSRKQLKDIEQEVVSLKKQLTTAPANSNDGVSGILKNITSMAAGVFGGNLLTGGLQSITGSFKEIIEAGRNLYGQNENLKLGFEQAGLSGNNLSNAMQQAGLMVNDLSAKYVISKSTLREYAAQSALLTGATGQNNRDMTLLAAGIEKMTKGAISGEMVIKAFGKNMADPETQASIGRLTTRFPQLAKALKEVDDPSKMASTALQALGPAFQNLEDRAQGPEGSIDRFGMAISGIKTTLGSMLFEVLTPLFNVLGGAGAILQTILGLAKEHKDILIVLGVTMGAYAIATNASAIATKLHGVWTKIMTAEQWSLNAAFAANPLGATIAIIGAAIIAYMTLTSILSKSTESKIKDAQAEETMVQQRINDVQASKSQVETSNQLATQYMRIGQQLQTMSQNTKEAAAKKAQLSSIAAKLNSQYPGLIKDGVSLAENLKSVGDVAGKTADQVKQYTEELGGLTQRMAAIKKLEAELAGKKAGEGLSEALRGLDAAALTQGTSAIERISAGIASLFSGHKSFSEQIKESFWNTKSEAEVNAAMDRWANAISSKEITDKLGAQNAADALKAIEEIGKSRIEAYFSTSTVQQVAEIQKTAIFRNADIINKELDEARKRVSGAGSEAEHKAAEADVKRLQKELDAYMGKEKASGQDAYETAVKRYEAETKTLSAKESQLAAQREADRLAIGRQRTSLDELVDEQGKLQALEAQKARLDEIAQVKKDTKKQEQTDYDAKLAELDATIAAQRNKVSETRLKITLDDESLKKAQRQLFLETLEAKVELHMADASVLITELEKDLAEIQNKIKTVDGKEKLELEKSEKDLQDKIRGIRQDNFDRQVKQIEEKFEREANATEAGYKRLAALEERWTNVFQKSRDQLASNSLKGKLSALDTEKEKAIAAIGDNEEAKKRIENKYDKLKEEEQAKYETRKQTISDMTEGMKVERERKLAAAGLEGKKKELEALKKLAEDSGQIKAAADYSKQLAEVNEQIRTKGTLLAATFDELGAGIGESINAMFAGDPEGMKNAMRQTLAMIAGYLRQAASAAVMNLLLSQGTVDTLLALPFPANILVLPVIRATIQGAVNALIGPMLEGLLSFSTGGRIDSPTLAIVGDGSRLGGIDREWIFRDDQLRQMMLISQQGQVTAITAGFGRLEKAIYAGQQTETYVRGSDIYIAYRRTAVSERSRVRT